MGLAACATASTGVGPAATGGQATLSSAEAAAKDTDCSDGRVCAWGASDEEAPAVILEEDETPPIEAPPASLAKSS